MNYTLEDMIEAGYTDEEILKEAKKVVTNDDEDSISNFVEPSGLSVNKDYSKIVDIIISELQRRAGQKFTYAFVPEKSNKSRFVFKVEASGLISLAITDWYLRITIEYPYNVNISKYDKEEQGRTPVRDISVGLNWTVSGRAKKDSKEFLYFSYNSKTGKLIERHYDA